MIPPFLIDISRLFYQRLTGRVTTGIDRVTIEYVRRYGARARAVLKIGPLSPVLSEADSARMFDYVTAAGPAWRGWWLAARACAGARAAASVKDCILLKTDPFGHDRPGPVARCTRGGARLVSILYDLIPATHPEYCRPGERDRHLARTRAAVAASSGLVAISRCTLEDVNGYAREAVLRMPPAIVAPLASGLPQAAPGPRPIAEPYFVVVGTIEPRKNHLLLLLLWRDLAGALGDAAPRLVIIGQRGWECENAVDLLERCPALRGTVIELDACGDRDLATYLRHAQALLFPSFAEGYGLPVAEALSLGAPVIASDLRVLREVAGEIPEYADPLDGRRWAELIADYANPGSGRRAAQLERLRGFRATTWEQHFEKVDAFLASFVKRES